MFVVGSRKRVPLTCYAGTLKQARSISKVEVISQYTRSACSGAGAVLVKNALFLQRWADSEERDLKSVKLDRDAWAPFW